VTISRHLDRHLCSSLLPLHLQPKGSLAIVSAQPTRNNSSGAARHNSCDSSGQQVQPGYLAMLADAAVALEGVEVCVWMGGGGGGVASRGAANASPPGLPKQQQQARSPASGQTRPKRPRNDEDSKYDPAGDVAATAAAGRARRRPSPPKSQGSSIINRSSSSISSSMWTWSGKATPLLHLHSITSSSCQQPTTRQSQGAPAESAAPALHHSGASTQSSALTCATLAASASSGASSTLVGTALRRLCCPMSCRCRLPPHSRAASSHRRTSRAAPSSRNKGSAAV